MQQNRAWRDYLLLSGKGAMMGAADAVPGVSGGTIAFITGIYEELINSLKQFGPQTLQIFYRKGIAATWAHINGNFLVALFTGILVSLLSIARVVLYLLDTVPELLWSFFFGLIVASCWSVIRHIDRWQLNTAVCFIVGTISAYLITAMSPAHIDPTYLNYFLAGMIAICAMILPGISGSFILLLLGMYTQVLGAVKNLELLAIGLFGVGCVIGLLSFSHVLSWMFKHYKPPTLALLGGFMLGSLNKIWPWKHTLESTIDRHGKEVPLVQENVLPASFESLTGQPSMLLYALVLMLIGAALIVLMEQFGNKQENQS